MTCNLCAHKHVCIILTSIVRDVQPKIAIAIGTQDKHSLFMSGLKTILAEGCKFYAEKQ